MKILIDMNLSPQWCDAFKAAGWDAVHWSDVGDRGASDREIMVWAEQRGYVVFTHDLDFGAMLAATRATAPSVIQVRAQDVMPDRLGGQLVAIMQEHQEPLRGGALIIVDQQRARLRILPLRSA